MIPEQQISPPDDGGRPEEMKPELDTFELLRAPDPPAEPTDTTADILLNPRRSVWDL